MNNLDTQYLEILKDIIENGTIKRTRNGDTISVFGRTIKHKMSEGFPILTSKRIFWKGVVGELIWFLRGSTNIKYLVDNDINIWVGDCYKKFLSTLDITNDIWKYTYGMDLKSKKDFTQEIFISLIKNSSEFAKYEGEL